ncbi:MAG: transmembrane anchor protein [Elusimicrobia bacterium GWB2_63_22]|nr:MAG: transmembrane anchor protein [Elusimicrobia bacterium GWB2_63_22]
MYNANFPHKSELPSTAKLIKSTVLAAVAAGVILVTVVMPAEYGIDPVGVGRLLGLKKMGEIKMSLAREAAAEAASLPVAEIRPAVQEMRSAPVSAPEKAKAAAPVRADEMSLTLAPNQGAEIKLALAKGKKAKYTWTSSGGRANYDIHGDSKELGIKYHGYGKGSEKTASGVLTAAFDGHHGWFWRNRTNAALTVTLNVSGEYTGIKKID